MGEGQGLRFDMHFGGHVKRGCEVLIQDVREREKKRKNQGFLPEHLVTIYPRDGEDLSLIHI